MPLASRDVEGDYWTARSKLKGIDTYTLMFIEEFFNQAPP